MKYLKALLLFLIIVLVYSSCAKVENYSYIPAITFNSFTPFCNGSTTDSAYLRINFTDGNGDIGYPQSDANASPNCYIEPTIDSSGVFVPIYSSSGFLMFPYSIPDITPDGKDKELNGIIQINLEGFVQTFSGLSVPGKDFHEIRFKVWIFDRAGNKSNVLITPTVYSCD
jgi:hypothetical protein